MKAGIIGLGAMGLRHLQAARAVSGVDVVAVCDSRQAALDAPAVAGVPRRHLSHTDLLAHEKLDVAVISTTAPSHRALVEACVDAGVKRILCEKPLACSVADGQAILDACARAGVRLAVNHCRRHSPGYGWLADKIRSGSWGELRGIRISCPGIGLGCLGTHFVDLMFFLSGLEAAAVSGWIDEPKGTNPRGAEFRDPGGLIVIDTGRDCRFVHQQIEDGAGIVSVTIDLTRARVRVEERDGTIEVLFREPSDPSGPRRPALFTPVPAPAACGLALNVVEMSAAVLRQLCAQDELLCDGHHGLRSLEVIAAAYSSHEQGHRSIALPLSAEGDKNR